MADTYELLAAEMCLACGGASRLAVAFRRESNVLDERGQVASEAAMARNPEERGGLGQNGVP